MALLFLMDTVHELFSDYAVNPFTAVLKFVLGFVTIIIMSHVEI